MGEILGYARVSTTGQDMSLQIDALETAGRSRIFVDQSSGALDERAELSRLVDHARPGDTVVVWRLDRLGRSLRHLIGIVNQLAERQMGFRSLTESIDTTTSGGKLIFRPRSAKIGAPTRRTSQGVSVTVGRQGNKKVNTI